MKPDQSFLAFGYDAEYMYSVLPENDFCDDEEQITKAKRNKYYFFDRFKAILFFYFNTTFTKERTDSSDIKHINLK